MAGFHWTKASEDAANLIAAGNLTFPQVAKAVDVTRQTVYAWRQHPDFKARVDEYLVEIREDIKRVGLADTLRRVHALNDRWVRMRRVIEERSDDPGMATVPGGSTGLLVRTQKMIGQGEAAMLVEEYAVDTGLLKELRDHEKQAAQELGQWADKHEVSGPDGSAVLMTFDQSLKKAFGHGDEIPG